MLRNYFKIAWRNLIKSKAYSVINIGGLATGMAVAMLIGLWIYDELTFNKQYKNYNTIARVMQNQTFNFGEVQTWGSQALQLGPELSNATYGPNFKHVIMSSWTYDRLLTYGDKKLMRGGNYMEPGIADMLSLNMLKGSRDGLKDPSSILLSQSVAKALFGDDEPIGKIIKLENTSDVKVAGVYEDLPNNSDFGNLQFIAPWSLMVQRDNLLKRVNWGNSWFQVFVQIADNANMQHVSKAIKNAKLNRVLVEDDDARFKPELFLHPMSRWRLYGEFKNGINDGGRIGVVRLFGIIGIFVLLLACINFMNLSTARSEKRAKEVGIRKTIGSMRSQLVGQFMSESLLVVIVAFGFSLALVQLALPFFNEIADKKINIPWGNPAFWLVAVGFILITGIFAGSYPALYLSSFNPLKVLKGTFRVGRLATVPRKVLVVVQFTVSIILIIGTIIVFRQIEFAKKRPVGYSQNGLIAIPIRTNEITNHYDAFRNELLNTGMVEEMAASETPVTDTYVTNSGFTWKGKDPAMKDEFATMCVTHEFGKTVGWQIIQGRDFSKAFATDSTGIILNESAAAYLGLKDPIGEHLVRGTEKLNIVGVVKDLVTQSPYQPVKQMFFYLNYERLSVANIKLKPTASASEALAKIGSVFKKYDTENLFEYKFADQEYAKKFGDEMRIGKLASFFAVLAIFISCLGLFGLSSFVAEQRTKEIGIRKVLGATVYTVWRLLSRDFVVLVILSLLIAIPLSYYFMHNWLQNYTYRANLSWWIFAAAGLGTLLLTLLTVSFQSIKAGMNNPVKSLRSE